MIWGRSFTFYEKMVDHLFFIKMQIQPFLEAVSLKTGCSIFPFRTEGGIICTKLLI